MSPKFALAVLLLSCVLLGLANAQYNRRYQTGPNRQKVSTMYSFWLGKYFNHPFIIITRLGLEWMRTALCRQISPLRLIMLVAVMSRPTWIACPIYWLVTPLIPGNLGPSIKNPKSSTPKRTRIYSKLMESAVIDFKWKMDFFFKLKNAFTFVNKMSK